MSVTAQKSEIFKNREICSGRKCQPRLSGIDVAAGITIILVVIGHLEFFNNEMVWYSRLRGFIYQFHMQVFFFLAGFLFFYTKDIEAPEYRHWRFVWGKIRKFGKPFAFFALFFYGMEWALADDRPVFLAGWKQDVYRQLFIPYTAYPGFLWFIYVLLMLYAVVPVVARLLPRRRHWVLLVVGVVLPYLITTRFLSLNFFAKHFLFFVLGMLYFYKKKNVDKHLSRWGWLCVLAIGVWLIWALSGGSWLPAWAAVVAVPGVLTVSNRFEGNQFLQCAGQNSFAIYLQNMTIIGGMYGVLTRGFHFQEWALQWCMPLFLAAAVGLPLVLERLIPRSWRLGRDLLGYP